MGKTPQKKKSIFAAGARRLFTLLTSYAQTTFNGRQFSSRTYSAPTECIRGLGSPSTKDLEFAALIDRAYLPLQPLTIDIGIDGSGSAAHNLGAAPRDVTLLGFDFEDADPNSYLGCMVTGWDATTITVGGTPGCKMLLGVRR